MRYVETAEVGIDDLQEYPGNARRHATPVLTESARVNGQYRSIVARRVGAGLEILAGHGTRDAFRANGVDTLRVEVIECDDEEAARIVLVDNRTADLGRYDDAQLLELLQKAGDDLAGTGWDEAAVADLEAMLNAPVSLHPDGDDWSDEDSDRAAAANEIPPGMVRIDLVVPEALAARFFDALAAQDGMGPAEELAALLDLAGL